MAVSRTFIPGFLQRVRVALYRHEARRAALLAFAGVGTVAVVLPLLGAGFGRSRATAVTMLGIGGLAAMSVVVVALILGVIAPRRRWGTDHDLARWVGGRKRDIASDLLSSVELADPPVRPGAPSPLLIDALITATNERLDGVEPEALLPEGDLRRAARWALAALAINVGVAAIAPRVIGDGWRALVALPSAPYDGATLSNVPLVGDLEATLRFPPYSRKPPLALPSSSGDVRGLPGTTVELRARVLAPASAVEIVVESVDRNTTTTIPAKLDGDQVTAALTIDKSARYRFAVQGVTGQRSIETTPRSIEAEPDQAPSVQLMAPAEALDVTNLRRVELAYVIEDDFGISSAELVWEAGKDHGKKPLPLEPAAANGRAQGKMIWDIAEVQVPSGGEVRYWIQANDNDTVSGPNIGKSRELRLRVVSPRERHEETLERHQEVAEKLIKNLGGRLTLGPDDSGDSNRDELARQLREVVVEVGSIAAAYEKDPHASETMRKALIQVRERLDKLETAEQKLLPKPAQPAARPIAVAAGRFAGLDPRLIAELEEDTIALADWLDRERLEGVLDISDEISAHQKRLADLLAQYQRTKDPRLLDEIEREMHALERSYAELDKHQKAMAEDVLDQYVNRSAIQPQQGASCLEEVRRLIHAGQTQQAQQKLEQCHQQQERASSALEGSLAGLRGERFSDEQKKLDEVMNELADVAKDQDDIAGEANRIYEAYVDKADDVAKDHRREAGKKVSALVDKLRHRIGEINEAGLTPFAKEELDIVQRRMDDVDHMVSDGDLSEALGMARQAKSSLETIAGELEAALTDDPKSKWTEATQDALDGVERSGPVARELITELQALSPKPDQIMSADDQRALERLRHRQGMNRERAKRLADRTKQLGGELPGDSGPELGKKLGGAIDQMNMADDRMKSKDPSGTREATRAAADALAKAQDRARSAARQAQEGAVGDEPVRIPGADEYRAPERFREDLLEAMKKKGATAPEGYDEMIKRYYQELVK